MNESNDTSSVFFPFRGSREMATTSESDSIIERCKSFALIGDYENALRALPLDSHDREIQNCRAVCLMRLGRFNEAIAVLRTIAVNWTTVTLREDVPRYIQLNFAAALAFGGRPAGALDVISEARATQDTVAVEIKAEIDSWVSQMSWPRRLDWKLNRIATKSLPVPSNPLQGRFKWELTESTQE